MRPKIIALFLITATALVGLTSEGAVTIIDNPRARVAVAGGGATYLIKQDFEGTGYDNSESWTETTNPDEDYATAPAPLVGSQSIYFNGTGQRATSPTFTGQLEVWAYFQIRIVNLGTTGGTLFTLLPLGIAVDLNNSAGSGSPRIGGSVNSARTTDAMTTGTTYHVLIHYIADQDGGAASAFGSVEFNTSATFTGSGNKFTSFTTGTETGSVTGIRLQGETGGTAVEWIFDKARADDVAIGNNPE